MPERVYVGESRQYFPRLSRWVEPGDTVEFEEPPTDDVRFVTAAAAKKTHTAKADASEENPS